MIKVLTRLWLGTPLEPWLVNDGILISWFMKESLYNWVGFHPLQKPNQPGFFSLLTWKKLVTTRIRLRPPEFRKVCLSDLLPLHYLTTYQWLFLVPVKGGRWHIIPQLAVYTTYIPLIYCLLGGYMLPTTFHAVLAQWSLFEESKHQSRCQPRHQ